MKKIKILLATAFMGLALTGCGMNAEKLAEEMMAASEGKQMTQASVSMEMNMSMEVEGASMDMSMDAAMEMQTDADPYASYMSMEMTIDAAGEQTTESMQIYSVEEDEALVNYVYTESTDKWEKQELDMSVDEVAAQTIDYNWLVEKAKSEELVLAEETQTVNESEVYVLSFTLEGEEMQNAFEGLGNMTDIFEQAGVSGIDFTSFNVPTTYYIDKETYLPVKIEMDIEGMGEMMDGLMASIFSQLETDTQISIDVQKFHASYDNIGYDDVEIPTVPKEGLIIANQKSYNPDKGDGTYVIQESGDAMKITVPDGWSVTEMGYDTVTIQRDDKKRSAVFTMHTNVDTGLAFRNYVERGDVLELLKAGNYDSHGTSDLESEYSGMWIKAEDKTNYYYAWTATGERCFLFVKMTDFTGKYDRNLIDTILPCAEEYDLMSE